MASARDIQRSTYSSSILAASCSASKIRIVYYSSRENEELSNESEDSASPASDSSSTKKSKARKLHKSSTKLAKPQSEDSTLSSVDESESAYLRARSGTDRMGLGDIL